MKKYILPAVLALGAACTPALKAQSQFLPAAGYPAAEARAEADGMASPVLRGIATLPGFQASILTVNYSYTAGTSSLWAYAFAGIRDGRDTTVIYIVSSLLNSYVAIPPPVPLPTLPFPLEIGLPPVDLMSSDEFAAKLQANSDWTSFRNNYQGVNADVVAHYMLPADEAPFTAITPIWRITFAPVEGERDGLDCRMNANTGDLVCLGTATSVAEAPAEHSRASLMLSNDAELLLVRWGALHTAQQIQIVALDGSVAAVAQPSASGECAVPLRSIAAGTYFAVVTYADGTTQGSKFSVSR